MSSRDFGFSNSYRPHPSGSGPGSRDRSSQWDQGRGGLPRVSSGDYDRERERDRDRIHDRDCDWDRDRDRDRDRRTEPRDREGPRRDSDLSWSQATQNQLPKMAPDKAATELAKCLRALCDIMNRKVQLSNKRDIETKALKKREQDYNNKIAGAKQFPALNDLYAKNSRHHKEIVESIDKELATLNASYQNVTDNFADTLVKALPISDIKTRQIIDTAKGELDREITSSQLAQGERFQKLEDAIKLLGDKHEAQDQELTKLKRQNDKLCAGENTAGGLDKEKEQLRSENLTLKKQLDALTERMDSIEAWKAEYPNQTELQKTEISKFLEQAKVEWAINTTTQANPNTLQDDALHEQMAALGKKVEGHNADIDALRKDVDGHEDLLANVDIENLDDTIAKVSEYPRYSTLNDRVTSQQAEIDSLKGLPQSTKQELEKDFTEKFKGFSDKIIDYCGPKFKDIEGHIKNLEATKSSESEARSIEAPLPQAGTSELASITARVSALASDVEGVASGLNAADTRLAADESRIEATETNDKALQSNIDALRADSALIRNQFDQRCGALEAMVESLDDQWKNMNTTQMAQCIFENLNRLQPGQLTPEVRQFHARLTDVEKLIRDEKQERIATRNQVHQVQAYCLENFDQGTKRGPTEDEKFPGFKRMRMEGVNNVDGVSNGHAHP